MTKNEDSPAASEGQNRERAMSPLLLKPDDDNPYTPPGGSAIRPDDLTDVIKSVIKSLKDHKENTASPSKPQMGGVIETGVESIAWVGGSLKNFGLQEPSAIGHETP